jgi:hypothetical protein
MTRDPRVRSSGDEAVEWAAPGRVPLEPSAVAVAELAAVLEELGVDHRVPGDPHGPHLELPGGLQVDVKTSSRPTISRLQRLGLGRPSAGVLRVLVADQLDPGARKALKDAGWAGST